MILPIGTPFNLSAHSSGEHQCDHLVIADERPERILKRRGLVLLDQKMREPGAAVTRNQAKREEPPSSGCDQINDQSNGGGGANQVKPTRRGSAVFRHVEGPEF